MKENLKKEKLYNLILALDQKTQEYRKLCLEYEKLKSQQSGNLKNPYYTELLENFNKNLADIIKLTENIKKFEYETSDT